MLNTNQDQELVNLFFNVFVIPRIKESLTLVDAIAVISEVFGDEDGKELALEYPELVGKKLAACLEVAGEKSEYCKQQTREKCMVLEGVAF